MPKICHVLSYLLDFMELHGDQLCRTVSPRGTFLLPEYRALSLSGRRVVQSRLTSDGQSTTTKTTEPKLTAERTFSTRNDTETEVMLSEPGFGSRSAVVRRSLRGGGTVTQTTIVTSQLQRNKMAQSLPRRMPKEAQYLIQRDINEFNEVLDV